MSSKYFNTLRYFEIKNRMCDYYTTQDKDKPTCKACPFHSSNTGFNLSCAEFERRCTMLAIWYLKKWDESHPVEEKAPKTYKDDFLEKFPDTNESVLRSLSPCEFYAPLKAYHAGHTCPHTCDGCWEMLMEQPNMTGFNT